MVGEQDAFSVTLDFESAAVLDHPAMLSVLFAADLEQIMARLVPGTQLAIYEGKRVVAYCRVSADPMPVNDPANERVATVQASPTNDNREDQDQAWDEFDELRESVHLDSGGKKWTRDQLHERR